MFDLEQAIAEWRRQMLAAGVESPVPLEELENHLRDSVAEGVCLGLAAAQAFQSAVRQIGSASELKAEFAKSDTDRRALRARLAGLACWLTAASIVVSGTWTVLGSSLGVAERIIVLALLWIIALYAGGVPYLRRLFPSMDTATARQAIKALSVPVQVWVLLAFFSSLHALPFQISATVNLILWALCGAYAASFLAILCCDAGEDFEATIFPVSPTPSARLSLTLAREEARRFNHDFIGTEHVLLGLLNLEEGRKILERLGVDCPTIRTEVARLIGRGPAHVVAHALPYTPRLRKALRLAAAAAETLKQPGMSLGHVLLGLVLEGDGAAGRVLKSLNINPEMVREAILSNWH